MVKRMAKDPLILALANPTPEILPEEAKAARPDAIIATGRSDYPNQVNNVLCFPFLFRGALDVGATTINEAMKSAAVRAIASLAHAEISDVVATAYGDQRLQFGPDYLIPTPFDPRLIERIAPAVAKAAMDSGVASRPLADLEAYRQSMARFMYQSGASMEPVFAAAKIAQKRIAFAEGEDDRVLRAAQIAIDESLGKPVLVGRPDVINPRIQALGLRLEDGQNCEIVCFESDRRYEESWRDYYGLVRRSGVTQALAREGMRNRSTLIAAMLLRRGDVDAMMCGTSGAFAEHLNYVRQVIGLRDGVRTLGTMNMVILGGRPLFMCDTYVNFDPTPEQLAELTLLAAEEVRRFGLAPSVALLSHSSFGSADSPSARKMRAALALIQQQAPDLAVEGEMHADAALSKRVLDRVFPDSHLTEEANLLIMPSLDAANIAFNLLRVAAGGGVTVGPILLGADKAAHILTQTATVRGILNMTALAVGRCGADRRPCPDQNGGGVIPMPATAGERGTQNMASETSDLHRIIVVGGGAGGLELVTRLGNKLGRYKRADVTLIDKHRAHLWKPLLHEIGAGSMDLGVHEIDYLAQAHWHHFRYRIGELVGLDRQTPRGSPGGPCR